MRCPFISAKLIYNVSVHAYGPNRTHDLTIMASAASRHQRTVLKAEEIVAIEAIRQCQSPDDLTRATARLMENPTSGQLMYIHTAVSHL